MKIKYNSIFFMFGLCTTYAQNQCDIIRKVLEELTSNTIDFPKNKESLLHCCGVDYIGCKGNGKIFNIELNGDILNIKNNVPESLTQLVDIERIAFINNKYEKLTIPNFLNKFPKLDTFEVTDSQIFNEIPESIGEIKNLKSLVFVNDNIKGPIPESLGSLTNLESLYLENNIISGSIPNSFGNLKNLQILTLKNNKLGGSIPTDLIKLKKLEVIELSGNALTEEIPEDLGDLDKLRILDLSNNQLTGSLPESITKLKKLEKLYLGYNNFYGTVDFANELPSLKEIELNNSGLFGILPNFSKNVTKCSFSEQDICIEKKPTCASTDSPCTPELHKKVEEFNKYEKSRKRNEGIFSSSKIIISLIIIIIPLIGIVIFLRVYKWYSLKKENDLLIKQIERINSKNLYYDSEITLNDLDFTKPI
ncbi:L domain-like protein [Neocallimastix lanati (nom. inval.)]|uniref:L domain-like protein n=1 Tax=Neocallimastix californiae TaxID=1754190 RepID=A0A1Y2DXD2_9FUNG|nr:L domain-like protein [Neocallimastix sp. JGI-2020a]ORY63776.1 L domain-like protein [Neocallimastix californiae]|eukprot:ORY63776.1 L domain-like protein [Neocallimastix californiae]